MSAEKWPEKWSDSMCVTMVGVHLNPSDYEHAAKCVNAHEELVKLCERLLDAGCYLESELSDYRKELEELK